MNVLDSTWWEKVVLMVVFAVMLTFCPCMLQIKRAGFSPMHRQLFAVAPCE
jgi:hypothetical protein